MFGFGKKKNEATPEEKYAIVCNGISYGERTKSEIIKIMSTCEISGTQAMIKINETWTTFDELGWRENIESPLDAFTASEAEEASDLPITEEEKEEDEDLAISVPTGKKITCPHCWQEFDMADVNYISQHIELTGDPILGSEAQQRFLPTKFNEQGYAIDAKGLVCQDMACPNCHLRIPEAVIDLPFHTYSIVGAPACGKSYFLTSMVWQLRKTLSTQLDFLLADTDATFNSVLNNYESILFLNRNNNEYVALPKTELQGNDFSNQILLKGMSVDLPLPFVFTLTPLASNIDFQNGQEQQTNIILYDNAGEHFEPGRDRITNLATMHLMHSNGILFLFDPLADSRMVRQCDAQDPQVSRGMRSSNQLVLLTEMINRIKKYKGMRSTDKYEHPIVVVIPKYDAWKSNYPIDLENTPFIRFSDQEFCNRLDIGTITNVSYVMRNALLKISPEVVSTCETFFSTVYYIPVSALGKIPDFDVERGMIAIRPGSLNPIWAEVPMLIQLWYDRKIQAVSCNVPDAIPIVNYVFTEHSCTYTLPGTPMRESIPLNYCGFAVYNEKLSQYIMLPQIPQ